MSDSVANQSAIELIRRFRQLRVLVIGDAMLDTYLEGSASRLCSEGPVPVVYKTAEYRIPGGAANTAANLRALDAQVDFLALLGADLAGSLLRDELRKRGIGEQRLVEDSTLQTLHKLRILADGQYVVRFDEGGLMEAPASKELLLQQLEQGYAACDLVVISDYRYGVVSEPLLARLCELHRQEPKVLLVDSKALQRFQMVPATVVTPNYFEARILVDGSAATPTEPPTLAEAERLGRQLLARLATEHVAITLAEQGVLLLDRQNHVIHIPAHPVAQANDVGAGDSFASALALALAAGGNIVSAAQIAIDAASIAVTKRWTAIVQQQELLQRVSLREYQQQSFLSTYAASSLATLLESERAQQRRIVFTNGVFDILHAGHIHFLRQARTLGDILVVGLNSDEGTRRLKGAGRPINSERDRAALVAALDVVDYVVLFDEETPTELIRLLRPDIHVKGGDYAEEALPEAEAVREGGGRVVILPLAGTLSTSRVIERIMALAGEQDEMLAPEQGERR